ncbi:hydrolase 76 protein [Kappamyces sp. JEL0680]|nr:hydrolase 76 protein [Kappamyces sp. JEL0680]
MLAGGLAWLYKGTQKDIYIQDAHRIVKHALDTFTQNGVIVDLCETTLQPCPLNQATSKGTGIRGLGYVLEHSKDKAVRESIKAAVKKSVEGMLPTCNKDWDCGHDWVGRNAPAGNAYNVHLQMNAVELMTTHLKGFIDGAVGTGTFSSPNITVVDDGTPPVFSGATSSSFGFRAAALAVSSIVFAL